MEEGLVLPEAFCQRMERLLGDEYGTFLASYEKEPQKGLRVNTVKCRGEAFIHDTGFSLRETGFVKDGYYLDGDTAHIGNTPEHHAGMFYIQEPAAMIPAECADIRPGMYVLDVCAAPGGKSTQLAAKIGEEGLLVSNEFVSSRAKILLSNIERLGIPNAVVTNTDAAHLRTWYPGAFDCVLVDAPCSGEGMFRKNPLALTEWSEENVKMCAERSFGILSDASYCLRHGGLLIYSTCTFAPEENEELIARFLDAFPDYTVEELPDAIREHTSRGIRIPGCREDLSRAARCYPHVTGGEGQFVCVLKKGGDDMRAEITDTLKPLSRAEEKTVQTFFSDLFRKGEAPTVKKLGDTLYAVPEHLRCAGVCFSCGAKVGEIKGDRIVPHHQLFSAYGKKMKRQWDFAPDDPRLALYLHGDTVTVDPSCTDDGFGCVTVSGCPLGGAKKVGNTLKNHYPKGLRRN